MSEKGPAPREIGREETNRQLVSMAEYLKDDYERLIAEAKENDVTIPPSDVQFFKDVSEIAKSYLADENSINLTTLVRSFRTAYDTVYPSQYIRFLEEIIHSRGSSPDLLKASINMANLQKRKLADEELVELLKN